MKYIQKLSIALALFCAYAPSLSASAGELFDLIAKGDSKQVEEFLENGGKQEINTPITNNWAPQWTPLYLACNFNNLGIVEILLKNGANPNTLSNGGQTPLFRACCYENLPIIEILLKYGANPNTPNSTGETPLYRVCNNNALGIVLDIVKALLENGANPNTPSAGGTPLHKACMYENLPIIEILLKYSANPNTPNTLGKTPLYIACSYESLPMIELLLKNGADATLTSNNGESPLSTICTWRIKERKELLMMLIPSAKNLPQNTKTFIELVISTLADQIQESSTIAPKVPQNDGLFRSPVVENPGQKIACIEEFTKIFLFEPRKKQYTWLDEDTNLNKFKIICPHDFQYSPSTCRIKINFGINPNQYAFLLMLQKMARTAIVQPKAITNSSNKTSSKAKQYSKLCDIIIKCHKPSSTETLLDLNRYGN